MWLEATFGNRLTKTKVFYQLILGITWASFIWILIRLWFENYRVQNDRSESNLVQVVELFWHYALFSFVYLHSFGSKARHNINI